MIGTGSALFVAVPCAIIGAASFGLASVIQQRVAKELPADGRFTPRLVVRLLTRPVWLASVVTLGLGLALQMTALAWGPLVLIQPLGVTSALFGALFSAVLSRRRVDGAELLGAVACLGGLAIFIIAARPSAPVLTEPPRGVVPLAAILALVVLSAVLVAKWGSGEVRSLALALAAAVCYGVTAGLIKLVVAQIQLGGITEPWQHWAVYVACVTGPPGFVLSQHAFQQGKSISLALSVITTVDPLVAIAVGVNWLGERIVTTAPALSGSAAAAVLIIGGVAIMTRRGERLGVSRVDSHP